MTKIYNEVIIDMNPDSATYNKTLYEDSYIDDGPIALCGGGGGAAGEVKFAAYIETFHKELMDDATADSLHTSLSMFNAMNLALTADPYQTVNAYNPDSDFSLAQTALNTGQADYAGINPTNDISGYATSAATIWNNINDESDVDEIVREFENESTPEFQSQLAQYSGAMADIGAVNSTAFIWGLGNLHAKRFRSVNKFRADLKTKNFEKRTDFIANAKKMMIALMGEKLKMGGQWADMQLNIAKTKIVAKNDQVKFDAEYDVKNAMWEINLVERGLKAIGAPGGGSAVIPNEESQASSAVAGGLSGAATGFAVGGPWGAVAGAAIGIGASFL